MCLRPCSFCATIDPKQLIIPCLLSAVVVANVPNFYQMCAILCTQARNDNYAHDDDMAAVTVYKYN